MFIALCKTVLPVSLWGYLVLVAFGDQTMVVVPSPHHLFCCKSMHMPGCATMCLLWLGTSQMLLEAKREAPKSPQSLQNYPLSPSPLLLLETGVMGTAQSASPVGSQFPSLQHSDHSAPLGAGFLLQSDNDNIPSSPRREVREMLHVLSIGDC